MLRNQFFYNILVSLRPKQWTKNLIIFVALVFSQNLLRPERLCLSIIAFCLFCLLSGAIYILNDIMDKDKDKQNPKKSRRPITAGKLKPKIALFFAFLLVILCFLMAFTINAVFLIICLQYIIIQVLYSLYLKHVVILDVFCIAFGFVLRLVAGAAVISVPISSWFIVCTMLISLFLALSKRRSELLVLRHYQIFRPVLKEYGSRFLDQSISLVSSATVVSYALYTLSAETILKFSTKNLIYTIPLVLYGVLRYLFLVYKRQAGDQPEMLLITDKSLIVTLILYITAVFLIIY